MTLCSVKKMTYVELYLIPSVVKFSSETDSEANLGIL